LGRVFAFEASPDNALILQANVGLNRALNCEVVHAAAGAKSGTLQLVDETVGAEEDPGARSVPMVALDDFCLREGITSVDLLKVDVEGFEGQVLKGAQRILAQRPAIALELHLDALPRYGSSPDSVLALIELTRYQGRMMVRPDWVTLRPFSGIGDLPGSGVVNLFLAPRPR
jgi:FkbM family methyltransferase